MPIPNPQQFLFPIDYGDIVKGIWVCDKCESMYFPLTLKNNNQHPPFKCDCGNFLKYYDAKKTQRTL